MIPKCVSVDKTRIVIVISEDEEHYFCEGEVSKFKVAKSRCVAVDDEYLVAENVYGLTTAIRYAKNKGYLKE